MMLHSQSPWKRRDNDKPDDVTLSKSQELFVSVVMIM